MKKKVIIIIVLIIIAFTIAIGVMKKTNNSKVEYKIANIENYNYVKYKEKDKYGIIDRSGNIIIEANYDNIEIPNPEKDIFICHNGEKITALNGKKEQLFTQYNKIEAIKLKNIASTLSYEKTVLKYEKNGLYGLIDLDGKEITKNIYTSIENLQSNEGKMIVSKNEKQGVINIKGMVLVQPNYDSIATDNYYDEKSNYVESGFIVSNTTNDGYRYGYINYKGEKILNVEYNDIIRVNNQKDLYLIAAKNGQYGLYKEKKQLIKPEYQSITYTENGAIIIEKNEQLGIANLKGEIKVETKYSQIDEDGIYLYARTTRENDVYDVEGNKVDINFNKKIYKTENENYNITTILNNDITYYGIENKQGTELANANYKYIEYIYKNYFIAQDDDEKYGVINANGKIILDFEYDLIQKIKNKNMVQAYLRKSEKTKIYSSNIELVANIKSASIKNEEDYINVFNKKESIYLDKDGNKIEENSEIVKKDEKKSLPDRIGKYSKYQYSLDDVYFE